VAGKFQKSRKTFGAGMGKASEKQKLWKAFAEWIRLRDSPEGHGSCISCKKLVPYPNSTGAWHAGHLWPRSVVYNSLYFNEMNVHGQCSACNTFLEGNTLAFRKGVIERYGVEVLDELEKAKVLGQGRKWYDHEYKELAAEYRKKSREMKKERGIS